MTLKTILSIFLTVSLLVGCTITISIDPGATPEVFPTPTQEVAISIVRVTVGTLNVRSGPGTTYAITRKVNYGDTLLIVAQEGQWMQTAQGDWIISTFVEDVDAS